MIFENISLTVGNTPIVKINNINSGNCNLFVKLESFNPCSSIKDRIAVEMIENAILEGKITDNTLIVEPTSGNTGIGLAMICAQKSLNLILTMPDTMSVERKSILQFLGAEIILTPGNLGMKGAISEAENIISKNKNSFMPCQFSNKHNPNAHYKSTGPEIWEQMNGKIDFLICGIGTGGTISGCGKFLKEKNPNIKIIGVEPFDSAVISGEKPGPHKIQGIGAGFIPDNLNVKIIDEIIKVKNDEAFEYMRLLALKEGIFAGISSGAALCAGIKLSKKYNSNANIVVILPDSGDKYISLGLA
ncbi:MAG: cysteine synthase A [Candidatus Muirbacterium halophilum]|nr:cysteine synthase A [Candidatus Muirbacterium halophilum]